MCALTLCEGLLSSIMIFNPCNICERQKHFSTSQRGGRDTEQTEGNMFKSTWCVRVSVLTKEYIGLRHLSAIRLVENQILTMISWEFLGLTLMRVNPGLMV